MCLGGTGNPDQPDQWKDPVTNQGDPGPNPQKLE